MDARNLTASSREEGISRKLEKAVILRQSIRGLAFANGTRLTKETIASLRSEAHGAASGSAYVGGSASVL